MSNSNDRREVGRSVRGQVESSGGARRRLMSNERPGPVPRLHRTRKEQAVQPDDDVVFIRAGPVHVRFDRDYLELGPHAMVFIFLSQERVRELSGWVRTLPHGQRQVLHWISCVMTEVKD